MLYDIYPKILDMRNSEWSIEKDTPGTNGVFLKTRKTVNGVQLFYKLSNYNSVDGFYGVESIMEILAQRIADWEGIPYVEQRLAKVIVNIDGEEYTTYCICSKDYRCANERRVSIEQYCRLLGHRKDNTEFLMTGEFADDLLKMMKLDYIIYNRDRHGANIELLMNTISKEYRLVPAFDNGCSLVAPSIRSISELDSSYFLSDAPVNNYIGSIFLLSNLKDYCRGKIRMKHDRLPSDIMRGLDSILDENVYSFIYDMLKARYNNAVDILNS